MAASSASPQPEVRIRLSVLHAAFDPHRRVLFARLWETLLQECEGLEAEVDLHVYRELDPRGSLPGWLQTLQDGVRRWRIEQTSDGLRREFPTESAFGFALGRFAPTHLVFLPDDVILGRNFVRGLLRLIAAHPEEVICGLPTHPYAAEAYRQGYAGYLSPDAFGAFAGTLPVAFAAEHLEWRVTSVLPDVKLEGDQGVFVHLMATGRRCLKTLPGLVDHAEPDSSLDASDLSSGQPRKATVFFPDLDLAALDWTRPVVDVGRTSRGNHWRTFYDLKAEAWDIERTYRLERDKDFATVEDEAGILARSARLHTSGEDSVLVAVPEYRGMVNECRASMMRCVKALGEAGIPCEVRSFPGQSLVTRARNIIAHVFMTTRHTVLFQWDDDVECLDPEALVKMLATGHDVLGGAYPFRDGSGSVVVGPKPAENGKRNEYTIHVEDDGTCSVKDLATGFLMVRRHVLAHLMMRHPELLCQIDGGGVEVKGAPHWALFDTRIDPDGVGHRRKYLSEDWTFSRRCREAGYDPRVYVPPILRHWGMRPSDGHMLVAYGFQSPEEVYGEGSAEAAEMRARGFGKPGLAKT